jgi:hypothetical protein
MSRRGTTTMGKRRLLSPTKMRERGTNMKCRNSMKVKMERQTKRKLPLTNNKRK